MLTLSTVAFSLTHHEYLYRIYGRLGRLCFALAVFFLSFPIVKAYCYEKNLSRSRI